MPRYELVAAHDAPQTLQSTGYFPVSVQGVRLAFRASMHQLFGSHGLLILGPNILGQYYTPVKMK